MAPQQDEDTKLNPGQADYDQKVKRIGKTESAGTGDFDDSADNSGSGIDRVRDAEENPGGGWKNNVSGLAAGVASKATGGKLSFIKKKGPIGVVAGLIITLVVALGGFFGGSSLLLSLAANLKVGPLSSVSSVLKSREKSILLKQLSSKATTGLCQPITIRCKFSTMSKSQISVLEDAGFKVNTDGKVLGIGRSKITSLELIDENGVITTITADTLAAELETSPKLASAIDKAFAPRLKAYSSSAFKYVLNKIGATKLAQLPKTTVDKMAKAIKDRVSGITQAQIDAKLTPTGQNDSKGNPTYIDESGATITAAEAETRMAAANTRYASALKLRSTATSMTDFFTKSSVKATMIGVGAVSIACSAWNIVRTAESASRYLGAVQLANYAMIFLGTADAIKAGDATPEQVEALGNILTTPNSAGLTAMDSRGMKNVQYGDISPIPDPTVETDSSNNPTDASLSNLSQASEVTDYVNGAGVGSAAKNTILKAVSPGSSASTSAAYKAADGVCGFVNNAVVGGIMIGVGVLTTAACVIAAIPTLGASVGACGSDVAVQLGIAGAMVGSMALATNKLNSLLSGNLITGHENGNQAGNAIASGAGALNTFNGLSSGLGYLNKTDAGTFQAYQDQTNSQFAAIDQSTVSPFDSSNPNTFMGKLTTGLLPLLTKTSSLGSYVLSLAKLPLTAFSSLFSKVAAQSYTNADAGVCADTEYNNQNIATDINCNPIVGQTTSTLALNVDDVLNYMINNSHIDETTGAAKSSQYKDYVTYCAKRDIAFGTAPDGSSSDPVKTGKVCQDGYVNASNPDDTKMYNMFRAYLSYSIAEEGMSGEATQALSDASPDSSSTTTQPASITTDQASLYQDSTNVACADGTTDAGTDVGYDNGQAINIRLCSIPGTIDSSFSNQPMHVNSRVSGAFLALIQSMGAATGSPVHVTSSFRTMAEQIKIFNSYGSVRAAKAGYSNHQMGLAVDFQLPTGNNTGEATKSPGTDKIYDWLTANASNYGIAKLSTEAWHWQAAGAH